MNPPKKHPMSLPKLQMRLNLKKRVNLSLKRILEKNLMKPKKKPWQNLKRRLPKLKLNKLKFSVVQLIQRLSISRTIKQSKIKIKNLMILLKTMINLKIWNNLLHKMMVKRVMKKPNQVSH
jgi:hypothetical protein